MIRLPAFLLMLLMPFAVVAADPAVTPDNAAIFSQADPGQVSVPVEAAAPAAAAATSIAQDNPAAVQGSYIWTWAILAFASVACLAAYIMRPKAPALRIVPDGAYAERQRIMAMGRDGEATPARRASPTPGVPVADTDAATVSTFDLYLARAALLAGKGGGSDLGRG